MASIYIISPSSAVRDKAAFARGVKRLKTLGHSVEVDPAALASHMRFAGDDATRLAAIHRAAASGADVVMTSRGGYGLTRILPSINTKAVAKSIERGSRWVGYSDFCALKFALLAKYQSITWAGPDVCDDFGTKYLSGTEAALTTPPDDIMEACFDDLVQGINEGAGWRMPKESAAKAAPPKVPSAKAPIANASMTKASSSKAMKIASNLIASTPVNQCAAAPLSIKNATLWGGNLCVTTALLGTPYMPQIDKGVLFFEDVAEHPYRVERMLTTWLHAGILQRQRAIVLGQFSNYKLFPAHDKGFKLQTVVDWLRTQTKVPVLTGMPFGHVPTKVCLPVGAKISLNTEDRDALMFWG
jgi:muramoyltetrapeptide carboxypeptidase